MTNDISLPNYISVSDGATASFGGSQTWFDRTHKGKDRRLHMGGCGLVAVGDFLLYLSEKEGITDKDLPSDMIKRDKGSRSKSLIRSSYQAYLRRLSRIRYPIFPYAGSFNFQVPLFVNSFLRKNGKRERLHFVFLNTDKHRHAKIEASLKAGYPVILIMSAHLFRPFSKEGVNFYTRQPNDQMVLSSANVFKHYVTITGIHDPGEPGGALYYEISSWGRRYYISRRDLKHYINHESSPLTSGIFCLD